MTMTEHTAKAFDVDLQELTRKVAEMGGLAEKLIADSVEALTRRDMSLAQRVVTGDAAVDALQHEIEEKAVNSPPTAFSGACTTSTAATGWKVAPPSLNRMPASCRSSAGSSSKPMA